MIVPTIAASVAINASNNARIENENKLSAKHLAIMNNQECEYQIKVQGGYQCMTETEYNVYKEIPPTTGEYVLISVLCAIVGICFFGVLWMVYDTMFN